MMHRSRFWMFGILSLSLVLLASSAFAAQNVANTSQKGSLLVFPYITVDDDHNTVIHISNTGGTDRWVQCMWQNERKVVVNFTFKVTRKGSIIFDAKHGKAQGGGEHDGVFELIKFPTTDGINPFGGFDDGEDGSGDASHHEGQLVCFATNTEGDQGIAYNHLKGEATVIDEDVDNEKASFEYNAWSFIARAPAATLMGGSPLNLSGLGTEAAAAVPPGYDACPTHLYVNFSPDGADINPEGADQIQWGRTRVAISSCTMNLREIPSGEFNVTLLNLNIWDANENKKSATFECADGTWIFKLSQVYNDPSNVLEEGGIGTTTALIKIVPKAEAVCEELNTNYTAIAPGIVGVKSTEIEIWETADRLIGTTLYGAGATAGSVIWDAPDPDLSRR